VLDATSCGREDVAPYLGFDVSRSQAVTCDVSAQRRELILKVGKLALQLLLSVH
jgi:hypothetical protein